MTQTNSEQEFILNVTEEDYQEGLKKGWTDEDMPPGEHKFRRVSPDRVYSNQNDKARIVLEIKGILL
jgi:flavin reductase (DIM6/NTAB) family NADH-FMN oxidoreductase RutF